MCPGQGGGGASLRRIFLEGLSQFACNLTKSVHISPIWRGLVGIGDAAEALGMSILPGVKVVVASDGFLQARLVLAAVGESRTGSVADPGSSPRVRIVPMRQMWICCRPRSQCGLQSSGSSPRTSLERTAASFAVAACGGFALWRGAQAPRETRLDEAGTEQQSCCIALISYRQIS